MIVYKLTNGFASDLRYEEDDYIARSGERSKPGWDQLPELESLHEPEAVEARAAQAALELKRFAALQALNELRLEAAISDPNAPQEVKDYAAAREQQALRTITL